MKSVTIYTDGACSGNPGPGGWGAILMAEGKTREISGGEAHTTNNRMEMMAAISALGLLKEPCAVDLYSDSRYVIDALGKGWAKTWRKNGWMRKTGPALNPDLWEQLLALYEQHKVTLHWVKGHSSNPYNNRCDELAVMESKNIGAGKGSAAPLEQKNALALHDMSKLGFGLMRLPKREEDFDIEQIKEMVDAYIDGGGNYFDTAYVYAGSEAVAKEVLIDRYPRESFLLTTKLHIASLKEKGSPEAVFAEQLSRTGTSYFDLYLLHSISDDKNYAAYEESGCFDFIRQKKQEGSIRHIGFSFHGDPALLERVLSEHPEMEYVQLQLNYLDWVSALIHAGPLYEIARKHKIPIIVMEPVKGGILARPPEKVSAYLAKRFPGQSPASLALRYAGSFEGVVTVLSGMSTRRHMEENTALFRTFQPLSVYEMEGLLKARELFYDVPFIACTECNYCLEGCPMHIRIPEIFKVQNARSITPKDFLSVLHYRGLTAEGGKAESCTACGACEDICPQKLAIIPLLKAAAADLDKTENA